MKILALETSTLLGSVALLENDQLLVERSSLRQKSHSEVINGFVDQVLNEQQISLADVDYFAVGVGPGSFTGIRTALNIGKTFSYCYKKPIVEADSLINLSQGVLNSKKIQSNDLILPMINAFKNMVYFGIYETNQDGELKIIHQPDVVHVSRLKEFLKTKVGDRLLITVGDGFKSYEKYFSAELLQQLLRIEDEQLDYPKAVTLGKIAYSKIKNDLTKDWNLILPLYIRSSEAEENKKGIIFEPLNERKK